MKRTREIIEKPKKCIYMEFVDRKTQNKTNLSNTYIYNEKNREYGKNRTGKKGPVICVWVVEMLHRGRSENQ